MNNVDKQYIDLLKDILENGTKKNTRAGEVLSVFGRMMRFNLKDGLPLLTTKKVFYKGCIYELLWFLNGDTNIKYLVDNGVNIWNDDGYRYYCSLIDKHNQIVEKETAHPSWASYQRTKLNTVSKEEWLEKVKRRDKQHVVIDEHAYIMSYTPNCWEYDYVYGDLGPVYGKQWRNQFNVDQIKNIINTLKNNPDDRRMLCVSWNNFDMDKMALPPCHYSFQFYTKELENGKRELSCLFSMRSNDFCCGNPFNILQYALLTYMMAEICDMEVGELIFNGGDVHVYTNHIEQAKEQLQRNGSEIIPKLSFARKIYEINDFKYEDFIIENYNPDPPIKYKLNVG